MGSMYGKVGVEEEKKNIMGIYMNDKIEGNAFESSDKDTFRICDEIYIGEIYEINIRGGWDDWSPSVIKINGREFNYGCQTEINYNGVPQALTAGTMPYNIVVETATCDGCGINFNFNFNPVINLKIYGKFNDDDRIVEIPDLGDYKDSSFLHVEFQRGEIDTCLVEARDIL